MCQLQRWSSFVCSVGVRGLTLPHEMKIETQPFHNWEGCRLLNFFFTSFSEYSGWKYTAVNSWFRIALLLCFINFVNFCFVFRKCWCVLIVKSVRGTKFFKIIVYFESWNSSSIVNNLLVWEGSTLVFSSFEIFSVRIMLHRGAVFPFM